MTMEQTFADASVPRGCGKSRDKGGTYWETASSPKGQPIEFWIIDPPVKIDEKALGLSPQGLKLVEIEGVYHAFDWVGAMHYPNVADFIEEARRYGVSRRCELSQEDYALLSKDSKLICVHSSAYLDEPSIHWGARIGMGDTTLNKNGRYKWEYCPKSLEHHMYTREVMLSKMASDEFFQPPMCAGLWWEDCVEVEPFEEDQRLGVRTMPAFRYRCASSPKAGVSRSPAIFATFPFGRLAIVDNPDDKAGVTKKIEQTVLDVGMAVDIVKE